MTGRGVAAALLLALAACQAPVESPVTLGGDDASYDPRLPGLWYGIDDSDPPALRVSLLIAPRSGTSLLDVLVGYAEPGGEDAVPAADVWRHFGAFQASVRPTKLLDRVIYAAERDPGVGHDYTTSHRKPGFVLFTIMFDDRGDLYVSGLSGSLIKQYGAGYGVSLIEEPIEGDDTYRLVDATENELRSLVLAVGPALFGERWGPFHRAPDDAAPFEVKGIGAP